MATAPEGPLLGARSRERPTRPSGGHGDGDEGGPRPPPGAHTHFPGLGGCSGPQVIRICGHAGGPWARPTRSTHFLCSGGCGWGQRTWRWPRSREQSAGASGKACRGGPASTDQPRAGPPRSGAGVPARGPVGSGPRLRGRGSALASMSPQPSRQSPRPSPGARGTAPAVHSLIVTSAHDKLPAGAFRVLC